MEFPRQEFQSRLQFPSPGDLPDLGINPASPTLAGGFFTTEPPGKPVSGYIYVSYVYVCSQKCGEILKVRESGGYVG